jgi:hypothetical protein
MMKEDYKQRMKKLGRESQRQVEKPNMMKEDYKQRMKKLGRESQRQVEKPHVRKRDPFHCGFLSHLPSFIRRL